MTTPPVDARVVTGSRQVPVPESGGPAPVEGLHVLFTRDQVLEGIERIADDMAQRFRDEPVVNIIPVMTGALQFSAMLSFALERRAPGKWLISPIFAAAYAADGDLVAPVIEFPARFEKRVEPGAPAVIVDDLLDSGTTMAALATQLRERHLASVHICVLIERVRQRVADIRPDFCAFHLEREDWLVGFGMDTGRRFRGFDAVYMREPDA